MKYFIITLLLSSSVYAGWGKWIRGAVYVGSGIYAVNKITGSVNKHTDSKDGVSEDERECRNMIKRLSYNKKSLKRFTYCCKQIENPSTKCDSVLSEVYK